MAPLYNDTNGEHPRKSLILFFIVYALLFVLLLLHHLYSRGSGPGDNVDEFQVRGQKLRKQIWPTSSNQIQNLSVP